MSTENPSTPKMIKVLAYITRDTPNGYDLLVFDHRDIPEAGTHVVAGTVDEAEDLCATVVWEAHEEAGLADIKVGRHLLTTHHFHAEKKQWRVRNYFHLTSGADLPAAWSHRVSAGEEDKDMVFDFYWLPLAETARHLTDLQGQAIDQL